MWVPYDAEAEDACSTTSSGCGRPTSSTTSSIEVTDCPFANGVIGKLIKYNMEERQRIKIVDYTGSKQLESTKIDEKLKEENVTIRLDSFVDDAADPPRRRRSSQGMLSEKGYQSTAGDRTRSSR